MNQYTIRHIESGEVLDSRGEPTVMTVIKLAGGAAGNGVVPSGASTGKFEALELRDKNNSRYNGQGVLKACSNVNVRIAKELIGRSVENQEEIDNIMIKLDNSQNKSNLGANAILSVSLAVSRAFANAKSEPLYKSLADYFGFKKPEKGRMPVPIMNLVNGGKHASTNIALQEFQVIPQLGGQATAKQVEAGSEILHSLKSILKEKGLDTDIGDEGGFAPNVESIDHVFDMLMMAIEKAGYKPGADIELGIDAAANSFYEDESYVIAPPKQKLNFTELKEKYMSWIRKYPLKSIEDPFGEEKWEEWSDFSAELKGKKIMIIGDDLLATNPERLNEGIKKRAMNAILVKPNQIGTLTETIETIKIAQKHGIIIVVSHRSGETNDTTIADLAVACGAQYLKSGAPSRGERVAKYNRLIEIEKELT